MTYNQFQHFALLHQQVHQLAVALDFYHNINGRLEREDFQRATRIVTGSELPFSLVSKELPASAQFAVARLQRPVQTGPVASRLKSYFVCSRQGTGAWCSTSSSKCSRGVHRAGLEVTRQPAKRSRILSPACSRVHSIIQSRAPFVSI